MTAEVTIRAATLEDSDAVASLSTELGYPSSTEEARARLRELSETRDHKVYVATTGEGRVVGWVHVFGISTLVSEPLAELGGLVVSEHCRGAGVGRLLLAATEDWARAHGYSSMLIRSRVTRTEAHKFYENRGYRRLKTQEVFIKQL